MKRQNGQYYTMGNPFNNTAFIRWAEQSKIKDTVILEPFAGGNNLINILTGMGLCSDSASFDINPTQSDVMYRDTLIDFPEKFSVCVTNPPWLAKNSATLRGLCFPDTHYDNMYKVALDRCLSSCEYVAAIIPESFIRASLFHDRLSDFVSLTGKMFEDTGHPVGIALFGNPCDDVAVWRDNEHIGVLSELEGLIPRVLKGGDDITFNAEDGNVGLIALDNTKEASIRFCDVSELANYKVKQTGRHITKLRVDGDIKIKRWNDYITSLRAKTGDTLLTAYKGIRQDGRYRRRLDWNLARGIIHNG